MGGGGGGALVPWLCGERAQRRLLRLRRERLTGKEAGVPGTRSSKFSFLYGPLGRKLAYREAKSGSRW